MSSGFIQTYILNKFMVSTIRRQSSARLNPCMYYETLVWELDESGKLEEIIGEYESQDWNFGAMLHHLKLVEYFSIFVIHEST
jgi:hypothetical protein